MLTPSKSPRPQSIEKCVDRGIDMRFFFAERQTQLQYPFDNAL
jgi:hypothetical protein